MASDSQFHYLSYVQPLLSHVFNSRSSTSPELNETSDGSPKEYKNSAYLAFAALKIIIRWFERVNHFFLGPGHSHEEQDGI